jgi:hypothetical protein
MNKAPDSCREMLASRDGLISAADADDLFAIMQDFVEAGKISRGVMRVFIEMVQNLRLHGGARGSVWTYVEGPFVIIVTANEADLKTIKKVEDLAGYANTHAEELPSIIQKCRAMPMKQNEVGASLGFLEIRRLCGYDIQVSTRAHPQGHLELVIAAKLNHKSKL